jgi:septum formation protein
MGGSRLILASASPRRAALLDQLAVDYVCNPAGIDESLHAAERPDHYVVRMAEAKAQEVAGRIEVPPCAVLAADTTVVIDDTVLGKPLDRTDALQMLTRLSGRRHTVMTAVCLLSAQGLCSELVRTEVEFVTLSAATRAAYLATDEPWDKAGAYAIQGLAGAFVKSIHGSYSNVVGLPLCETWQMLAAHGIASGLFPVTPAPALR